MHAHVGGVVVIIGSSPRTLQYHREAQGLGSSLADVFAHTSDLRIKSILAQLRLLSA